MTRSAHERIAVVLILVAVAGMGVAGVVLSPGSARRVRITGQSTPGAAPGLAVLPPSSERDRLAASTAVARSPANAERPTGERPAEPGRSFARESAVPHSALAKRSDRDERLGPAATTARRPRTDAPERTPGSAGDAPTGFRDRAGFGADFAAVINRELFPLASECVDLARARNPELAGMLALHLQVIPIDGDRALVGAVEPTDANEIDDPDLFECLEQSSFAVEGLPRATSFDITIPIEPADSQ